MGSYSSMCAKTQVYYIYLLHTYTNAYYFLVLILILVNLLFR